jgi:hypothetical protein
MELAGGEKIWKYSESIKVAEAWRGGRQSHPDDILASGIPAAIDQQLIDSSVLIQHNVDYGHLAKVIAREISRNTPPPVRNEINMDENGFTKHIIEQGSKKEIRNQRYRMN